jgi:hypothetical protein
MGRRPRGITYAEAMDALRDAHQTLHDLLQARFGRETREQLVLLRDRHRDMMAAIEEFWRGTGPERRYWRGQAGWLIREFRRLHRTPERAAFRAAVASSQHRGPT